MNKQIIVRMTDAYALTMRDPVSFDWRLKIVAKKAKTTAFGEKST